MQIFLVGACLSASPTTPASVLHPASTAATASACSTRALLANTFALGFASSSRLPALRERWTAAGATLSIFPAVNASELDTNALRAAAEPRRRASEFTYAERAPLQFGPPGLMHDNTWGTALAHRNLYEYIVANSIPCALVIEDDAVPVDDFAQKLQGIVAELPGDFGHSPDVIKLDDSALQGEDHENSRLRMSGCALKPEVAAVGPAATSRLVRGSGYCTTAYVVSLRGADALLRLQTPTWLTADMVWVGARADIVLAPLNMSLRMHRTEPALVYQDQSAACERDCNGAADAEQGPL